MNLLYVCDTYCFVALSFRETESKNKRLVMWPAYHMHMCISTKVHKLKEFQVKTLTKNFNRGDTGLKYVENISSRSLKKTSDQRKLRLLSVYFSIFE